jgi:hypothetical protein
MKSATGEPWQSLNWRVTLKRSSAAKPFLETSYSQGTGFAPADKGKWEGNRHIKARAIAIEIETGKIAGTRFSSEPYATAKPIPAPRLGDVLQSLALDSRVLDEGPFEEWAANLGYDPDSRKAEAIWKECVEIATTLRAYLGAPTLEELQLAAEFN